MSELTLFDYASLPINDAMELKASAERIKIRLKRGAEDIIENGRDLLDSKNKLGHGKFERWIKSEFGLGLTTAKKFIQVFEKFGDKSPLCGDLKPSEIYLLAQDSTPEIVREIVIEKIENGEKVDLKEIERLKSENKAILDNLAGANREIEETQKRVNFLVDDRDAFRKQNDELRNSLAFEVDKKATEKLELERAKLIQENHDAIAQAERERDNAKAELERIKSGKEKAIKDGVAYEINKLDTELNQKRYQIENYERELDDLKKVKSELDSDVGALAIHKEAIKEIKKDLSSLGISFSDAFDTNVIPSEVSGEWDAIYFALSKLKNQMSDWRDKKSPIVGELVN
jgi:DNA repair exonuclease SbcCD ATPase subunit